MANPTTQANLKKLIEMGSEIIEPAEGLLACNDNGKGKLASVEEICEAVEKRLPAMPGYNTNKNIQI